MWRRWVVALPLRKSHWNGGWVGPRAGLTALEKQTLYLPGIEPRFLDQYSLVTIPAILPYDTKSEWVRRMWFSAHQHLQRLPCFQTCNYPSQKPNCVHSMGYPWPVAHSVKTQRLKVSRLARWVVFLVITQCWMVRWILKRWVNGPIIQEYQSIYFVQDISRGWLATLLAVFQYNRPMSFPTLQHRPETDSVSQKKEISRSYRTFGRSLWSYPADSFEHEGSLFCSQESAIVLSEEMESRPYSSQACFI